MGEQRWQQIPNSSPQTGKLIEFLRQHNRVGAVLTDEQLSEACGQDTRPKGKGYTKLASAVRYVLNHDGMVWQRQHRASAIKCLGSVEVVAVAKSRVSHVGRTMRRAAKMLNTVKIDDLGDDKAAAMATIAQVGALASMASGDTRKKLEARSVTMAPSSENLLKAFQ